MLSYSLDNLMRSISVETKYSDATPAVQSDCAGSFNDYLQRAQAGPGPERATAPAGSEPGPRNERSDRSSQPAGSAPPEKNDDAPAAEQGVDRDSERDAGKEAGEDSGKDVASGATHEAEGDSDKPETAEKDETETEENAVVAEIAGTPAAVKPEAPSVKTQQSAVKDVAGQVESAQDTPGAVRSRKHEAVATPVVEAAAASATEATAIATDGTDATVAGVEAMAEAMQKTQPDRGKAKPSGKVEQQTVAKAETEVATDIVDPTQAMDTEAASAAEALPESPGPTARVKPRTDGPHRSDPAEAEADSPAEPAVPPTETQTAQVAGVAQAIAEATSTASDEESRGRGTTDAVSAVTSSESAAKPAAASVVDHAASTHVSSAAESKGASATAAPQPSDGTRQLDRVRLIQRVERAFQSMGDEGGSMRIRLSPPELGSLKIEIAVRDGQLNARLEAETTSARNLLLDNLPTLRDRLAQQDIKIQSFDVDLMDRSAGGMSGQTSQDFGSNSGGSGARMARMASRDDLAGVAAADSSVSRTATQGSQLNIII